MSAAKYIGLYTSISIYLFSVQFLFLPVSHSVPRFSLYLFIYFFFFFAEASRLPAGNILGTLYHKL